VALRNIFFQLYGYASFTNASYITIDKCIFDTPTGSPNSNTGTLRIVSNGSTPVNATITKSIFTGSWGLTILGPSTGTAFNFQSSVADCLFIGKAGIYIDGPSPTGGSVGNGVDIYNCTFFATNTGIGVYSTNTTNVTNIRNCLFYGPAENTAGIQASGAGRCTEDYNRFAVSSPRSNVSTGLNSLTGMSGLDLSVSLIQYGVGVSIAAPFASSPLIAAGTVAGAPSVDIYGNAWTSGTDVGAFARTSLSATSFYNPTERNASTITIAPGSTSQSIELYLGATGLTASTSGLSARYNRTRTASVSIPLVARTIAQAWTSGGFAEVDATNMPGVYRLDVPDAALAAGADDVTIVVRGASGTNGAVMTVKLSSGGLTSAQTASAVWDPAYTSYTAANSMGARVLKTTVDNRPVVVGTSQHIHANVHAIVDSTIAADELSGALLHNGTDYISADLLTPVSAATSVHIGPYQLLADGLGADQPLDVNVGTATSIDVQVTDANGTGIDITGATVSAKVYNSGGTLVATYNGTATYADNGRLSFGLTTTVTNTSGTYTVTVTRTTGASDTQVFGPLRLYVRPV
jgi:hypothetical protein